jgi:hypothetical protein
MAKRTRNIVRGPLTPEMWEAAQKGLRAKRIAVAKAHAQSFWHVRKDMLIEAENAAGRRLTRDEAGVIAAAARAQLKGGR